MASAGRRPVREGLLAGDLDDLGDVRLVGTRCASCGETGLGRRTVCANCGLSDVALVPLSNEGVLWTYTVVRHRPPGAYLGPEPFRPFGLGLVELPEGLRVMAPLSGAIDALQIGDRLVFRPYVAVDGEGEVVMFSYAPAGEGGRP